MRASSGCSPNGAGRPPSPATECGVRLGPGVLDLGLHLEPLGSADWGSTPLPDASTYGLWGERLARLDRDGSVWVKNLRTDAAWTQVRAKSGASYVWAPCTSPVTSSHGRCTRQAATASVPRRSGCATS